MAAVRVNMRRNNFGARDVSRRTLEAAEHAIDGLAHLRHMLHLRAAGTRVEQVTPCQPHPHLSL